MFQPKMVSWKDYEGVEGFGEASQSDVDALNKALTVGQDRDPPAAVVAGDGFSLRVEDLSRTLVNTTYRMRHVLLWKSIFKEAAYNTISEYNELSSYGENPDALWVDEGDLPEEDDSTYERKHCLCGDSKIRVEGVGDVAIVDYLDGKQEREAKVWTGTSYEKASVFPTGKKVVCTTGLKNGLNIRTSPDHRFKTSDGFVKQSELSVGMEILCDWGTSPVLETQATDEMEQMYDLSISHDSHQFVANGIIVHNSTVKYIGTTRRVTHVATVINPAHGPVIAQEGVNGTMHLLRGIERGLFYGNSALSALQFDGFQKLITDNSPAANIIDLRGLPLSEDNLTDAALTVQAAPNYGVPTDLHLNPMVHSDLSKAFFPKERVQPGMKGGNVGLDLKGWTSPAGDVRFNPNVFITDGGGPTAAVGDAAKRPATPTISTGVSTPQDTTNSQFGADDAGSYWVKIQACNRYGRSAAVDVGGGAVISTVVENDEITCGVTPGSSVAVGWYELFRTALSGADGTERLVLRIPNTAGTGEMTIHDYNAFIPYTSSAFLFEQTPEAMCFKQLAPMIKVPLAIIDLSIRWVQCLYGVPQLKAPRKMVLFNNIGRATGYVGTP